MFLLMSDDASVSSPARILVVVAHPEPDFVESECVD